MKITKRQLRRIIKEEKARLLQENIRVPRPIPNPEMKSPGVSSPGEKGMKAQFAAKKLQSVYRSLMDMQANTRGPMYDEFNRLIILLEDAIDLLEVE